MFKKKAENTEWKKIKEVVDSIFQSTQPERDKMSRFLKQFQGDIWDEKALKDAGVEDSYKSKAQINLVFSTIEAIAPMLTDSRPITHVIPRQPFMEKLAAKYNKSLEYAWDALDMQMEIYKLVLYAMIMKKGVLKVYFDPEKSFGGDLCIGNVDPRDFFMAPGYDDIWKTPYCGERTDKPLSWIRANFPDAEDIKVEKSTFTDSDKVKAYKYGDASDMTLSARFATVYEVWMRDEETMEEILEEFQDEDGEKQEKKVKKQKYPNGKFVYFTNDQYLGTKACDYSHKLPPYVDFNIYLDPTNFLGMGEIDQIEGLNKEINLQFQAILDQARRVNNPNYEVDIDRGINPEEVKENFFKGGQIYTTKNNPYNSNKPAIEEIEFANMAQDVYAVLNLIPKFVEEISGVTDISKGTASKKERQSASEVAILVESSHTRTRQKVRNLEWTLKRVGYLLVSLMQQYYTEPRTQYTKDSEGVINYHVLGNSIEQAVDIIGPSKELQAKVGDRTPEQVRHDLEPATAEQYEQETRDLERLLESFDSNSELDPVLFDFDIVIQTNSTLPMDQQSLANLFIRLFQMKAVDAEAVLENLQIPKREEILARIGKQRQAAMKAKGRPPQGGQG